jgi:hypothetical protein
MTDRAIEPFPRRREPGGSSQSLLPAGLRPEPRQPAARAGAAAEPRRSPASAALAFLAFFDPLPSDYYLG